MVETLPEQHAYFEDSVRAIVYGQNENIPSEVFDKLPRFSSNTACGILMKFGEKNAAMKIGEDSSTGEKRYKFFEKENDDGC